MARLCDGEPTSSVLVADAHPLVRLGVGDLIRSRNPSWIVEEAESGCEALTRAAEARPPLVVAGLNLDVQPLEPVRRLAALGAPLRVLVLSGRGVRNYAVRAIRAGARGFVRKSDEPGAILSAVRAVAEGQLHLPSEVRSRILRSVRSGSDPGPPCQVEALTRRERQVFHLLGEGRTTGEIAHALGISPKTVESHRRKVMRKLDVEDRFRLLVRAVEWRRS